MRGLISHIALALTAILFACSPPKKSKSASSEGGEPENTGDPGTVNVDTNPDDEKVVDDKNKKVTDDQVVLTDDSPELAMAGTLAIDTSGLVETQKPDKVLAFPVKNGVLEDFNQIITAKIDAKGKFSIKLPRIDQRLKDLKATVNTDGSIDKAKLVAFMVATGAGSADDIEGASAADLKAMVTAEIKKAEQGRRTYVLVSSVTDTSREVEAASFAYIGLSAGGKNLFNIPAADAKKNLDLGTIPIDGSDAMSPLTATDDNFKLAKAVLNQIAATGATLKAIKNDYINTHPDKKENYHASPFFLFNGDPEKVKNVFSDATDVVYNGYGLYMGGEKPNFVMKNLCGGADHKSLEFIPPAAVPFENGGDFDQDHPMGNSTADSPSSVSGGRYECGSNDVNGPNDELFYASGQGLTDKYLNWNWGSGGRLQGDIPAGFWSLKIEGSTVGRFDLAAAAPLTDGKPNVFVPLLKVTVDDNDTITGVAVKFAIWDGTQYIEVTDVGAIRRGVEKLRVEFDDYDGTDGNGGSRISEAIELEEPDSTGSGFAGSADGFANTFYFPDVVMDQTHAEAGGLAVSYTMYGNSYRFAFQ